MSLPETIEKEKQILFTLFKFRHNYFVRLAAANCIAKIRFMERQLMVAKAYVKFQVNNPGKYSFDFAGEYPQLIK